VIATNYHGRLGANELDYLDWIRSIVHQIPENPKLIEIGRQGCDSFQVRVKIRNDQRSQCPSSDPLLTLEFDIAELDLHILMML